MKRPNRTLEIFSMSAIDLFASAMGAFIILVLVLIPYYLNKTQHVFLGLTSKANSYVMLVDMSGSMVKYAELMSRTAEQIIATMKDNQQLQIIGFQGSNLKLTPWQSPRNMAHMNLGNRQSATSFVDSLKSRFNDGTPTHAALKEALAYNSEAVFLMTDGAPNGVPAQIIDDITSRNGGAKEIHTIALGDYNAAPKLVQFLTDLAKGNKGKFIGISK